MSSCHRLNKLCPSQTPAPPRKRKEPKPGRIGELERRIMDLTARVESVQRQAPSPPDSDSMLLSGRTMSPMQDGSARTDPRLQRWNNPFGHIFVTTDDQSGSNNAGAGAGDGTDPLSPDHTLPFRLSKDAQWPEGEEAEELLAIYRAHLQPLFPFAVVPPRMTSFEMRQTRPFFWKAVMMEACHNDGVRQIALGNELLREIAEAAIVKPQKCLDLLQGLEIFLSWYHYNLNSFQMTNLLYLARSMCAGLGFSELQGASEPNNFSSEYLERMRAFAGTYYLVTVIFTTNKKPDGLMGTTYLEECCLTLEARMEYATDGLLVWLVRAQQLSQSICLALAFRNAGVLQAEPLTAAIERFEQQIELFRARLPLTVKDNPSLIGHTYIAEILIYEIGLQGDAQFPASPLFSSSYRLILLTSCLRATKCFLENRFAADIGEYPRFICMSTFDFIFSFLTALKLITLRLPGWDLNDVRQELEFDKFVERQVRDMEFMVERRRKRRRFFFGNWAAPAAPEGMVDGVLVAGDEDDGEDPFLKLAKKIRTLSKVMREELNNEYVATKLTMAADAGSMTVVDAQGLMHEFEATLWGEPAGDEWDPMETMFFTGAFG
ncbi:hypothetical protein OQA88_393 [Cercophora sp. LCS_1]